MPVIAERWWFIAVFMTLVLSRVPVASAVIFHNPPVRPLPCLRESPSVKSLYPDGGPPGVRTAVIISGSCLGLATAVRFGNISTPFTYNASSGTLTAVSPALSRGRKLTVDVTVTSANGVSATSLLDQFHYSPIHIDTVIDSNNNQWPKPAAGDILTLNGWGFGKAQGHGNLRLTGADGKVLNVTGGPDWSWSGGSIDFTLPVNLGQGRYQLTVVNQDGKADSVPFTIVAQVPYPPAEVYLTRFSDLRPRHQGIVSPGDLVEVAVGRNSGASGSCNLVLNSEDRSAPAATLFLQMPPLIHEFYLTRDGTSTGTPLPSGSYRMVLTCGSTSSNPLPLTVAPPVPVITSWGWNPPIPATPGTPYPISGYFFGGPSAGFLTLTPLNFLMTQTGYTRAAAETVAGTGATFWSDGSIRFSLPGDLNPGDYQLTVTNDDGYTSLPVVVHISPAGTPGGWSSPPLPLSAPMEVSDTTTGQVENFGAANLFATFFSNGPGKVENLANTFTNQFTFPPVPAIEVDNNGIPVHPQPLGSSLFVTRNYATTVPVQVAFTVPANASFSPGSVTLPCHAPQDLPPSDTRGYCKDLGTPGGPTIAGNHAHYQVTVQEWTDSLDPASKKPVPDSQYQQDGSPDGYKGRWVAIGSGGADLFGPGATDSDGANSTNQAGAGGTATQDMNVPVQLLGRRNVLRLEVEWWEGDTRLSGDGPFTGYIGQELFVQSCADLGRPKGSCTSSRWGYGYQAGNPAMGTVDLAPFQVLVLPVGGFQLQFIPYTILYQPPGNQSTAEFLTGTSFATTTTVGNSLAKSNKVTQTDSGSWGLDFHGNISYKGVPIASDGGGMTTKWDKSTTAGTDVQQSATVQSSKTFEILQGEQTNALSQLTPGSHGGKTAYWEEPFWYDRFVLLLHPQFAVYDNAGQPVNFMLGARDPSQAAWIPLNSLAACAAGTVEKDKSGNVIDFCKPFDIPPDITDMELTPGQAQALLEQDPFYPFGQSAVPDSKRATSLSGGCYIDPDTGECDPNSKKNSGNPFTYGGCAVDQVTGNCDVTLPKVIEFKNTDNTTYTSGGFTETISGVSSTQGNESDINFSLFLFGENSTSGHSTTNSQETDVANTDSTATSSGLVTKVKLLAGDTNDQGTVQVYLDNIYGSFMFVDPDAPPLKSVLEGGPAPPYPLIKIPAGELLKRMPVGMLQKWTRSLGPLRVAPHLSIPRIKHNPGQ